MTHDGDSLTKHAVLQALSFGQRVAEEEANDLSNYFVETEQWRRVWRGEVDVVFAPKGGGKSAIYSMLMSRESDLFDRGTLIAAAENPTGSTAFEEVEEDPPTTEQEFIGIWKLYLLVLIAEVLAEYEIKDPKAIRLIDTLRDAGLLTGGMAKRRVVRVVMDYVRRLLRPGSAEATMTLDPSTGAPTALTAKIALAEPTAGQRGLGAVSVDDLYEWAEAALESSQYELWLLLDRLDVAFANSRELEENALRALFRVYRDLQPLERIFLKVFLRSDIWHAITTGGFREASHITRELTLNWSEATLLQLVIQRIVRSPELCRYYDVEPATILSSTDQQQALFYRVFPEQVDLGSRKSKTFDWCLGRVRDGQGHSAPRELIHLMTAARDQQLKRNEIGEPEPPGEAIFDRVSIKEALPEVSEVRLTKTLFAEYPALKREIEALEGQKSHQSALTLAAIWQCPESEAREIAQRLVEVGFFERRGDRASPTYWVPFMYRPALRLVQGSAEGVVQDDDPDESDDLPSEDASEGDRDHPTLFATE